MRRIVSDVPLSVKSGSVHVHGYVNRNGDSGLILIFRIHVRNFAEHLRLTEQSKKYVSSTNISLCGKQKMD